MEKNEEASLITDFTDFEIEIEFFKRRAEYDIQDMLDFHATLEKELLDRGFNIPDPEDFKLIETYLRLENYDEVLYLVAKIIPILNNYNLTLTKKP